MNTSWAMAEALEYAADLLQCAANKPLEIDCDDDQEEEIQNAMLLISQGLREKADKVARARWIAEARK